MTIENITRSRVDISTPLTKVDERRGPLEDACHEGNYVLRNILSAARAAELK